MQSLQPEPAEQLHLLDQPFEPKLPPLTYSGYLESLKNTCLDAAIDIVGAPANQLVIMPADPRVTGGVHGKDSFLIVDQSDLTGEKTPMGSALVKVTVKFENESCYAVVEAFKHKANLGERLKEELDREVGTRVEIHKTPAEQFLISLHKNWDLFIAALSNRKEEILKIGGIIAGIGLLVGGGFVIAPKIAEAQAKKAEETKIARAAQQKKDEEFRIEAAAREEAARKEILALEAKNADYIRTNRSSILNEVQTFVDLYPKSSPETQSVLLGKISDFHVAAFKSALRSGTDLEANSALVLLEKTHSAFLGSEQNVLEVESNPTVSSLLGLRGEEVTKLITSQRGAAVRINALRIAKEYLFKNGTELHEYETDSFRGKLIDQYVIEKDTTVKKAIESVLQDVKRPTISEVKQAETAKALPKTEPFKGKSDAPKTPSNDISDELKEDRKIGY